MTFADFPAWTMIWYFCRRSGLWRLATKKSLIQQRWMGATILIFGVVYRLAA